MVYSLIQHQEPTLETPLITQSIIPIAYSSVLISQAFFSKLIGKKAPKKTSLHPIIFGIGSIAPPLLGQPISWHFLLLIACSFIIIPLTYKQGLKEKEKEKNSTTHNHPNLSPRENEIATLVKQGKTNKEIATILYIEESTVKNHLTTIFKKLNIRNRVQLTTHLPQKK